MENIRKWNNEKPPIIAIIAPQIASSASACHEALTILKNGNRIEGASKLPSHKNWLSLYRNHRKLESKLKESFRIFGDDINIGIDFLEALKEIRKQILKLGVKNFEDRIKREIAKTTQDELKAIQNQWNLVYEASMNDIQRDLIEQSDSINIDAKKVFAEPEMMFFLGVWFPCWHFYGEPPPVLMRKARNGDLEAIEKLVRVDSSVIFDSKIAEIYHQLAGAANKSKFEILTKSLSKGPKGKVTLQTIKYSAAGFISAVALLLGYPLAEPKIRSLFDAIAKDSGKADIDIDLPESPEAFSKAIQRSRSFWLNAVHYQDKK